MKLGSHNFRVGFGFLLLVGFLVIAAIEATAQQSGNTVGSRDPDDIQNLIRDADPNKESHIKRPLPKPLAESYDQFKKNLSEDFGFNFSLAYAYVAQGVIGRGEATGSGGQAELDFTWTVLGHKGEGMKGLFGGKIEDRHNLLNSRAPQSVAPAAGSIWTGAAGYGELDITASQLWYEHHFKRDRVIARVGKIVPFALFDYYKFKSPRTGFLGQVQNVNPTIAYPPSALGVGAGVRLESGAFAGGGVFDANGQADKDGFNTLFDEGELFTIGEIGWTPDFSIFLLPGQDYRPGNDDYHLTVWHADALKKTGRPEGWGITASAQKGFGEIVAFARYGYSNGSATPLKHMASIGVGLENVAGYENDLIGLSAAFGRPSISSLDDQFAIEAFYRLQLTPAFALTPDLQIIINPALAPEEKTLTLVSLRARLTF